MAELSTIGMLFSYGVETTAGTKPATFTKIAGALSLPEFAREPQQIDVTPLDETSDHRYIPGLANDGTAKAIQFNMNDAFETAWDAMVTAYSGLTDGKAMWFQFSHPDMAKGFFFKGKPAPLGFGGATVDSALNINAYITPNKIVGKDTKVVPS